MKKSSSSFDEVPILDLEVEGPLAEESRPKHLGSFRDLVEARRSVRLFGAQPIPEFVVRDCLDLALLAPNSSNLQSWEFHWVRSPGVKAELVKACLSQPAAATAAELVVCVARTDTWKEHQKLMLTRLNRDLKGMPQADSMRHYYEKIVPLVYGLGPLGIAGPLKRLFFWVRGLFQPTPREPCSLGELRTWAVKSTALACENLILAFQSHGYDTCAMEGMDSSRIAQLLSLSEGAVVVMVVAAGVRAEGGIRGPRVRFESKRFLKEW